MIRRLAALIGLVGAPGLVVGWFLAQPAHAAAPVAVAIHGYAFGPTPVDVTAGQTVVWTNQDPVAHTVTSDDGQSFASGPVASGNTFTKVFSTPGTYTYHCSIHTFMTGSVVVAAAPSTTTTTTTSTTSTTAPPATTSTIARTTTSTAAAAAPGSTTTVPASASAAPSGGGTSRAATVVAASTAGPAAQLAMTGVAPLAAGLAALALALVIAGEVARRRQGAR